MHLRIGTRGSALALAQTSRVCRLLEEKGVGVESVIVRTEGDVMTHLPLHEIGGYGLFVRALDQAILEGRIDAAVHSMKDIPVKRPAEVVTAAVLERDSPADFMAYDCDPPNIRTVGTSSLRRRAQLLRHHREIEVRPLRGNLDTRIRRLREGRFDAIVVAEAGLERMGLHLKGERLSVRQFVPSPNQGIIAVVCRGDPDLVELLSCIDHPPTRLDAEIERAAMEVVGAGCHAPLGIFSSSGHIIAEALTPDGRKAERMEDRIMDAEEAREFGKRFKASASDILKEAESFIRGRG